MAEEQQLSIEDRISRVMNPAEQPAEEVADTEPVETAEAPVEAVEAPAEEVAEAPVEDTASDEEVVEVSSVSQLSEYLGVAPEDLYNMTLPITVNGEKQEVTLSEWKDSITAQETAKAMREEAARIREESDAAAKQAQEHYKNQLAQSAALVNAVEQQLLAHTPSQDELNALRQTNPAEWAAKTRELEQARAQVELMKRQVLDNIQGHNQKMQQEQERVLQERINTELQALNQAWPELSDESKGPAEKSALIDFLKERGFSDSEIGEASDHRVLLLARDAMRYNREVTTSNATKKKVLKIAKQVVRPGAKQSKQEQAAEQLKPLRNRLRNSGKVDDAAELISRLRR